MTMSGSEITYLALGKLVECSTHTLHSAQGIMNLLISSNAKVNTGPVNELGSDVFGYESRKGKLIWYF